MIVKASRVSLLIAALALPLACGKEKSDTEEDEPTLANPPAPSGGGGSDGGGSGPRSLATGSADCASNPDPVLTTAFLDPAKVDHILALGSIVTGAIIKTHTYLYSPADATATRGVAVDPLVAPADGKLVRVTSYDFTDLDGKVYTEYSLDLELSCEAFFMLDHVAALSDGVKAAVAAQPAADAQSRLLATPIPVKAGDVLGFTGALKTDVGMYNSEKPVTFVNPARHTFAKDQYSVCPYEAYGAELRAAYLAKIVLDNGQAPPAGVTTSCRSASRDVAGTVLGAWFQGAETTTATIATQLAVGKDFDGSVLFSVHEASGVDTFLRFEAPQADPATLAVGEARCYAGASGWVYLKLLTELRLQVAHGTGACPGTMPEASASEWDR